jgi:hypothetical protein
MIKRIERLKNTVNKYMADIRPDRLTTSQSERKSVVSRRPSVYIYFFVLNRRKDTREAQCEISRLYRFSLRVHFCFPSVRFCPHCIEIMVRWTRILKFCVMVHKFSLLVRPICIINEHEWQGGRKKGQRNLPDSSSRWHSDHIFVPTF